VPVSAGLLADTGAYFAALTSYRDGDAAPIVERFSQATVLAIANGRQLVADLRDIRETWNDVITARSDSAVWKVADLLTRRPVVNAALLAQDLGWDEETVFMVELAARLHDIGKIGLPEGLLVKKRRLTAAEIKLAQNHVLIGAEILAQSNVAHMKMAEEIARFHHEHWDGGGYPFGLAYSAIPIAARITALADVFDAMTHRRPYQDASSAEDALASIAALRGKQFDPELTDLFRALVLRLQREVGDLDAYLAQAACESPFIRARRKIDDTLKQFQGQRP